MRTVAVRVATPDDAADVAAIYAPIVRDTVISFEYDEVTPRQMRQRIVMALERHPWLVAHADDTLVGYAYADSHRSRAAYAWSADVSVYLAPHARRQGVGRTLYTALLDLLRAQGYANAFAGVALPNPASVALHRSVGFTPIGVYRSVGWKFGAWHDVGWWQRGLAPRESGVALAPPIAFPLLDPREISATLATLATDPSR